MARVMTMVWLALIASAVSADEAPRTIVIGGDVAEILDALGETGALVGRDDTVLYPPELTALPSVGYLRRLSAESILSLHPQRLIVSDDAEPKATLAQLQASGVEMIAIPAQKRLDAIPDKVRAVAAAVGVDERGEALADSLAARIAEIHALPPLDTVRGMFLLSHSGMTPRLALCPGAEWPRSQRCDGCRRSFRHWRGCSQRLRPSPGRLSSAIQ